MESVIINKKGLPAEVARLLPAELLFAVENADLGVAVEEIRLRVGRPVWVCGGGRNLRIDERVDADKLDDVLMRACGGSLYSVAECIKQGFIPAAGGVRIGVCGEWTVGGVRKISSLAIRIPHRAEIDVTPLRDLLDSLGNASGLLLFSPPLGGKTSLLREIARGFSSGERALRVVVIDTRGELGYSLFGDRLCLDILSGYPRRDGLEIAARTLGAQAVICDEIGYGDGDAICELHGGGVPLIASVHAASLADLLSRRGIAELHRCGVFGAYVELARGCEPPYIIHRREDVNVC